MSFQWTFARGVWEFLNKVMQSDPIPGEEPTETLSPESPPDPNPSLETPTNTILPQPDPESSAVPRGGEGLPAPHLARYLALGTNFSLEYVAQSEQTKDRAA